MEFFGEIGQDAFVLMRDDNFAEAGTAPRDFVGRSVEEHDVFEISKEGASFGYLFGSAQGNHCSAD
jgi:hypothetical protein